MKARTLALLLLLPILAFAQVPKETTPHPAQEIKPPTPNAASHPLTGADIEAFLDGLLPLQLDRENIAGCVVAVVKDGQVIFEKGYGYSDVKARKAVSPTDTLFRPGSISKLFTWTSVMQLVEQGKLDRSFHVQRLVQQAVGVLACSQGVGSAGLSAPGVAGGVSTQPSML